ncbi:MAG TPA: guanylate kinase [Bacteroidetes bacterium]|nr:guanylate kinase [Bacteroidota bacterium]
MAESAQKGKMIIISAPSGAGKTTIVKHLLQIVPRLSFSVSACSRPRRKGEVNGKDYWFMTENEFKQKIEAGEFAEWEEVYPGHYYGTLKKEIERIWKAGKHVVFDVDVKGGMNLKKQFGSRALAIFVSPPSLEILEKRLRKRSTETEEKIRERTQKASREMEYASRFDTVLVNDRLEETLDRAVEMVTTFIENSK